MNRAGLFQRDRATCRLLRAVALLAVVVHTVLGCCWHHSHVSAATTEQAVGAEPTCHCHAHARTAPAAEHPAAPTEPAGCNKAHCHFTRPVDGSGAELVLAPLATGTAVGAGVSPYDGTTVYGLDAQAASSAFSFGGTWSPVLRL